MRVDGIQFRRNRRLVTLPYVPGAGPRFGLAILQGKPVPSDAVVTNWTWQDGSSVWARPIEQSGHSTASMAYGKDKQVYLMRGGVCYQGRLK